MCLLFLLVPLTNVIIEIHLVLLFTLHNTKNIAYHVMEVLIFYADKLMVMRNSKNLRVFNFAILLKSDLILAKYTCFTVVHTVTQDPLQSTVLLNVSGLPCTRM